MAVAVAPLQQLVHRPSAVSRNIHTKLNKNIKTFAPMLMTVYMLTKNVQILNWCSNTDEQPLALLQGKKKIDDKKTTNKKQTET